MESGSEEAGLGRHKGWRWAVEPETSLGFCREDLAQHRELVRTTLQASGPDVARPSCKGKMKH